MNIIVHYPTNETEKEELAKRVAIVHAQTVIEIVKRLPRPTKRKVQLINAINKNVKNF